LQRQRFLFAITSHGFGHMTRTLEIAREFVALFPEVEAVISTKLPRGRVERELTVPFIFRSQDYEPGTAQKNCFEVDVDGTLRAYREHVRERSYRIRKEEEFLKEIGCSGIVSDIPALPVRCASRLGIPAVGVSNFTWDWILAPLLEGTDLEDLPRQLAEDYRFGQLHLRLPFGPSVSPFPVVEPAPLVGRKAKIGPADVKRRLGLPDDTRRLVVVCPGGWGAEQWPPISVAGCEEYRFVLVGDLPVSLNAPVLRLPADLPERLGFADLVGAADIVLSKPGYGIASECVVNRTPMVGIERHGFREAAELVKGLKEAGPFTELSLDDFFDGRWEKALHEIEASEVNWQRTPGGDSHGDNSHGGARQVAARLGSFFQLDGTRDSGPVSPATFTERGSYESPS